MRISEYNISVDWEEDLLSKRTTCNEEHKWGLCGEGQCTTTKRSGWEDITCRVSPTTMCNQEKKNWRKQTITMSDGRRSMM